MSFLTVSPVSQARSLCALLVGGALLASAGCGVLPSGKDVDYQNTERRERPLDVPPDLIRPAGNDRFSVPASGVASRAEFDRQQRMAGISSSAQPTDTGVLPKVGGMSLERQGAVRVLVIDQPAEKLWPQLRQFWLDNGFVLAIEQPEIGLLETDWAENKAKMPDDFLRRNLGKLFDRISDTGERDRYRMRLERRSPTQTEVTISHRGLIQFVGKAGDVAWGNRPSDPILEDAFLRRIMVKLGSKEEAAAVLMTQADKAPSRALLTKDSKGTSIALAGESFDLAWRRVGLAIDRLGFTVEDRDRSKGLYFVRYRDPAADADEAQGGFLSRLFSSDDPASAKRYQVRVREASGSTTIDTLNADGKLVNDANAQRLLSVLADQLK